MEFHLSKRFDRLDKRNKRYDDEHRPKTSYMDPKLADINRAKSAHFNKRPRNYRTNVSSPKSPQLVKTLSNFAGKGD